MLSAVIFDFDGIIVNTEPLHYKAFQEILMPLGLGYSWDDYLGKYIGFDDRDALREAFRVAGKALSGDDLQELIAKKAAAFQQVIASGVDPYPGVVALVRGISGKVPLALCSGALRSDIDPILAQLDLTGVFDTIVTADEVASSKPDPESYCLTVSRLQVIFPEKSIRSEDVVAIEDTPAGIASAKGAGLKVLAVTNSYPEEKLHGTVRIVSSLAGIDLESLQSL
jgi:HAD superfamily hydrolase (TIGR01509 family)